MKHLLVLCTFLSGISPLQSQHAFEADLRFHYKNSVQLELFGHGLAYSLNYERLILNGSRFKTTLQAGAAAYNQGTGILEMWLPMSVNEILSFGKHHGEVGLGYVTTTGTFDSFSLASEVNKWDGYVTGRLGYRYQKQNGRFIARIAFTPFFDPLECYSMHPWGGLAFGFAF